MGVFKVLISGPNTVIGRILLNGLGGHAVYRLEDLSDLASLGEMARRCDVILHAASADSVEYPRDHANQAHAMMMNVQNVLEMAASNGVRLVVLASSVIADSPQFHEGEYVQPNLVPTPASAYGAGLCYIEALGRLYAAYRGLQVVCIRYGHVTSDNSYDNLDPEERRAWLSHGDCVRVTQAVLDGQVRPNTFTVMYATSDNDGRRHNLGSRYYSWNPVDSAPLLPPS